MMTWDGRRWPKVCQAGTVLFDSSTTFDGWQSSFYDANNHRTDNLTDAFGQLAQVTEYNDEGSGQVTYTTQYQYNLQGSLTQVTDHLSNTTTMGYDLLERKTTMSDPDMGSWTYQYDGVGNLTAQQDGRSQWLYLAYDNLNRLTSKRRDSAGGPLVATYTYDTTDKGQLYSSKAYDSSGLTVQVEKQALDRDDRYRLTEQQWIVAGGGTFRMATGYNAAGSQTSIQYPANNSGGLGEIVNNHFNSVGQLNQVISGLDNTHFLDSATYQPSGQVAALRLDTGSNGAASSYSYEPGTLRLQQKQVTNGSGTTTVQNLSYGYDDASNVTSITDAVNSSQLQNFGYDWLNRLTSASTTAVGTGQYSHTYAYNAIGNITSYNGNSYTYSSSQPHAVTAAHGNSYSYDTNGNQTSRTIGSIAYTQTFDIQNRLLEVKQGSTTIATFVYDTEGSRVLGTVNGTTTVYVGGVFEYQAGATTTYFTGPNGPVAMRRSGYSANNGIFYMLGDHLGSTSVLLNQNGTVAKQEYYYPFGGNRGSAFSNITTKRFTGQYHESGLPGSEGLSYYNARWYDSQLGRFISSDTLVPLPGNPQSFNRFSYVHNNALRYTDPSGHILDPGGTSSGPPPGPSDLNDDPANSNLPGYYYVYYQGYNPYPRGYNPYGRTHRERAGLAFKYWEGSQSPQSEYTLTPQEQLINQSQIGQSCQYWQDCYEPVVTREEMSPDAFIFGVSGSGGLIQNFILGQELVWNFDADETDLFGLGGAGTTIGAKLVGTGIAGFVWNLDQNSNYVGPFSTLTLDIAYVQGFQLNLFWASNALPFTGNPMGISLGYSPVGAAAALSYSQTYYIHELSFSE